MTKSEKAEARSDARKPQSQSERFIAKARELGLDEREEAFDAALTKVARHKQQGTPSNSKKRTLDVR